MARLISTAQRFAMGMVVVGLTACTTVSRFEGATPGTTLAIKGLPGTELPRTENMDAKATGQYEFLATAADGQTMYGILPLKVNGGRMAASILLFAPALVLGGFRDVFPFYQVDPVQKVLRFKMKETDEWRVYTPIGIESARAKASFDGAKPGANAS